MMMKRDACDGKVVEHRRRLQCEGVGKVVEAESNDEGKPPTINPSAGRGRSACKEQVHPLPSSSTAVFAECLSETSKEKALQAEHRQSDTKEHPVELERQ